MKKIILIGMGFLFLAANAFALDISQFVGTWSDKTNGKEIKIEGNARRLKITGLLTPDDVIFSNGEEERVPGALKRFYSAETAPYGNEEVFIIAVSTRATFKDHFATDLYRQYILKLINDSKTLLLRESFFEYEPENRDVVFVNQSSVYTRKE